MASRLAHCSNQSERSESMRILVAIVVIFSCSQELAADDWPQWMGPNRDNIWRLGIVVSVATGP